MKRISKEEFKQRMQEISQSRDIESSHAIADDLLCEVLESLGYKDGVQIYSEMTKWYA